MISVAMTTYNGERYIEEQLKSILAQTVQVDEIVICDDGSTDRTLEIINGLSDERIKVYRNDSNVGYIENFYRAISLTKGDYIFLADQDDIWNVDKVDILTCFLDETKASAVCTNFSLIDADGEGIEDDSYLSIDPFVRKAHRGATKISTIRLAFGNVAQGCTYCFRAQVKDVYLSIHNPEVVHDLQILMIASCIGRAYFLNQKLIKYRIHDNNSIGLSKKNRNLSLPKRLHREPFMYRFIKQINSISKVDNLWLYRVLYYCRIPYFRSVFRQILLGK